MYVSTNILLTKFSFLHSEVLDNDFLGWMFLVASKKALSSNFVPDAEVDSLLFKVDRMTSFYLFDDSVSTTGYPKIDAVFLTNLFTIT